MTQPGGHIVPAQNPTKPGVLEESAFSIHFLDVQLSTGDIVLELCIGSHGVLPDIGRIDRVVRGRDLLHQDTVAEGRDGDGVQGCDHR